MNKVLAFFIFFLKYLNYPGNAVEKLSSGIFVRPTYIYKGPYHVPLRTGIYSIL
jgi:hypothetical protein